MHKGEVLVVTLQHISSLPLSKSMLEFCDDDDSIRNRVAGSEGVE